MPLLLQQDFKIVWIIQAPLNKITENNVIVTDHAPVIILHCDHKQIYKFVNQQAAEIFGLKVIDITGKHIPNIYHSFDMKPATDVVIFLNCFYVIG